MKKLSFYFFVILLILGSCSEENNPIDDNKDRNTEKQSFSDEELIFLDVLSSGSTKYTDKEIIEKALDVANSIYPSSTKSTNNREIKSIQTLTTENISGLRSDADGVDTLAYLLNFENNGGFTIIAADKRINNQVLVCTGEGNLELETDNPGFLFFLEQAEDYLFNSIKKAEQSQDSLKQVILDKLLSQSQEESPSVRIGMENQSFDDVDISTKFEYGPWETVERVAPLSVVEWGQSHNMYTKEKGCGGNAQSTGCVATAVAQIMAYWQYPSSIDGYPIAWSDITQYTDSYHRDSFYNNRWIAHTSDAPDNIRSNIARLMERIGSNVGMTYDCDGSGASTNDAANWMKRIGYAGGELSSYAFDKVKNSLDNGSIVLARGNSHKKVSGGFLGIGKRTSYTGGHAWNYDGYLLQRREEKRTVTTRSLKTGYILNVKTYTSYNTRMLVHVNWGWEGYNNGYYSSGVFNANITPMQSDTRNSEEGTANYYKYNLGIYTNIRR